MTEEPRIDAVNSDNPRTISATEKVWRKQKLRRKLTRRLAACPG